MHAIQVLLLLLLLLNSAWSHQNHGNEMVIKVMTPTGQAKRAFSKLVEDLSTHTIDVVGFDEKTNCFQVRD